MSVVFLRESESSSLEAGGSARWYSHHSMTLVSTASLTWKDVLDEIRFGGEESRGRVTYIRDGNGLF